jgi:hypothetical protein
LSAYVFGARQGQHRKRAKEELRFIANTDPAKKPEDAPPPKDKLVTTLAGLIPAEILVFHALLLQATTTVDDPKGANPVTKIVDDEALLAGFVVLCILAAALYLAGVIRSNEFNPFRDIPLALVPPLAFVGWTALQRATAFDAVDADAGDRAVIGIVAAGTAIAISTALSAKEEKEAEEKTPEEAKAILAS